MDARYVKSLLSVIEAGSIAKAAQLENLSAPAIGQRICALEDNLKTQLLIRGKNRSEPTAACLRLMPMFEQLTHTVDELRRQADPDGLSGPYRLGMVGTALADYSKTILQAFQSLAPQVELILVPGSSLELYEKLLSRKLDSIIVVRPPYVLSNKLKSKTITRSQTVFLFPEGHCAPKDLPLLVYDKQAWGGSLIWNWLSKTHSNFDVRCEMDEPLIIANLVANGVGAAYLPYWQGLETIQGIHYSIIDGGPIRDLSFIYSCVESKTDSVVMSVI